MSVSQWISELEGMGVQLWEEAGQLRFRAPSGVMTAERIALLREHKAELLGEIEKLNEPCEAHPEPEARFQPFPLTDVQSAYLLGRRDTQHYGGVGCQVYLELEYADLDVDRLQAAWRRLIQRHDMLRVVIHAEGFQTVLPEVEPYTIASRDLSGADACEANRTLDALREELGHQRFESGSWPLFDLSVTKLGPERSLLHVCIDFLIADFLSAQRLLEELEELYEHPEQSAAPLELTFRDYVIAERRLKSRPRYQTDRNYWWGRVDELPAAPELPTLPIEDQRPGRFRRLALAVAPMEWNALKARAAKHGVSVSCAVLAAYAETVGRWSRTPHFTVDVTVLNRRPLHPQVAELVGDFTSVNLLEVDQRAPASFGQRAQVLQARLWEDMDHGLCSGVEVIRELGKRRGRAAALMPIVFTSALGVDRGSKPGRAITRRLQRGLSETPQVWIDCQAMESSGQLLLHWDVRSGIFPEGAPEAMFASFADLVTALGRSDLAWAQTAPLSLPSEQLERRRRVNDTAAPLSEALLHEGLVEQARRTPERIAVVSGDRSLCYAELLARGRAVADELAALGCASGEIVAIVAEKSWRQPVAALGVLLAGCVYLPIDREQPRLRRDVMLRDSGVRVVLSDLDPVEAEWPAGVSPLWIESCVEPAGPPTRETPRRAPGDLAYVIYTSGTTGVPKGVMITHRSALNTVLDVNQRFGVTAEDRVLGVANLGFDLSVYDLFGPLCLGGALVIPESSRRSDPSHWLELIERHSVTLWNSVPAQFQMLLDYAEQAHVGALTGLRLALWSGDWIPVELPARARRHHPELRIVSLGGATEAAIWSIFHEVETVAPGSKRIPYGRPLANQSFEVFDGQLRSCPDWVVGELHIGGVGLAVGYLGDLAKTGERFIRHPETGERFYKTGDLGRYLPDGNIELLGRADLQVKIRGHRIELAEIEAVLQAHPSVGNASVLVQPGRCVTDARLVAAVEPLRRDIDAGATEALRSALEKGTRTVSDAVLEGSDQALYVEYHARLDAVALDVMLHLFQQSGLFRREEDGHDLEEVLRRTGAAPQNQRLVRRWLKALVENGKLRRDADTGLYHGSEQVRAEDLERGWQEASELGRQVEGEAALVQDYFRRSADHLPELLRAEGDAVQLLFPEGRLDVTRHLYHVALFNRWANRIATELMRTLAEHRSGFGRTRVLEVGAGVGGTSADVIPALAHLDVEYLFTDLSKFFANQAREQFEAYPWVRYGVLDLNGDYRTQGLQSNSFDLVLSADVLHSTRDVQHVVRQVRELLAPGGWFVFLEMTRDHYQIMTSMEILIRHDPLAGDFEDLRRGRDQTFLRHEELMQLLTEGGADTIFFVPGAEDLFSQVGMYVYAARFKGDRAPLDAEELVRFAAERLPASMLPSRIEVVDGLPLTPNGKIDRAKLGSWLASGVTNEVLAEGEQPQGPLEESLAGIWTAVIGLERVGRLQEFFEVGGDSLLAAQVATAIQELPEGNGLRFEDVLQCILANPTIASLAGTLATRSFPEAPSCDAREGRGTCE